MQQRQTREPGPDHPITIAPTLGRVTVTFAGRVVAETLEALTLREASYPPVQYIPRKDVDPALLRASTHKSWCPYKGEASYFSLSVDGKDSENAIWTYEAPPAPVAAIKDYIAFYPDRVDRIAIAAT